MTGLAMLRFLTAICMLDLLALLRQPRFCLATKVDIWEHLWGSQCRSQSANVFVKNVHHSLIPFAAKAGSRVAEIVIITVVRVVLAALALILMLEIHSADKLREPVTHRNVWLNTLMLRS